MSISHAQRARLGIFMTAGAVLLLFFLAIPLGFKLADKTELYFSLFDKGESISGLVEGAEVRYNGVKIGNIEHILLDPINFTSVKVVYRIDKNKIKITNGMQAQTGLMGITGLLFVELTGGHPDSTELTEGSQIETKPSLMHTITGKAEVIIAKVEILLNHLNELTNPDSLASIKKIVDNVAGITQSVDHFVKDVSPDIKDITSSASRTMKKVDAISGDIKNITGNIDDKINFDHVSNILAQINTTAISMKSLSETLDLTVAQSREDISVSMQNLREALENVNELSRILMENPSLIIKGDNQKERRIK